jgi:hypothetical protein
LASCVDVIPGERRDRDADDLTRQMILPLRWSPRQPFIGFIRRL